MQSLSLSFKSYNSILPRHKTILNKLAASPVAAFSLRLLREGHSGPAVRVARTSDGTEMDIGFKLYVPETIPRLDEETLLAFTNTKPVTPLNAVSGSSAAFSLRRLRDEYSGPCIRVKRSSDAAELDIGFVFNDQLSTPWVIDTVALLQFCGAGAGFVVTWYDQTGNGNHVATTGNHCRIVNNGAVEVSRGKATVLFIGTGSLVGAAPINATQAFISQYTSSNLTLFEYTTGPVGILAVRAAAGTRRVGAAGANSNFADAAIGVTRQYTDQYTNLGVNTMRRDGVAAVDQGAATSVGGATLEIGGRDGSLFFIGAISELIFFTDNVTAENRLFLERSQIFFYDSSLVPSALVSVWYDQSGRKNNVVQDIFGNRPRIVNAGVVEKINDKPCIQTLGSNNGLVSASRVFTSYREMFVSLVVSSNSAGAYQFCANFGNQGTWAITGSHNSFKTSASGVTGADLTLIGPTTFGVSRVWQYLNSIAGNRKSARYNGVSAGSGVPYPALAQPLDGRLTIGTPFPAGGGLLHSGTYSEVIAFNSVILSATQRRVLEQDQGATYGIAVI